MRVLFVSFFVVLIDQVAKLAVKGFSIPFINFHYTGMYEGERIRIIGNFFRLTFIENPGMAFGIDPGINFKLWITVFSLLASIGIIVYLFIIKNEKFTLRFSLALILGGAIGNLIDRLFYGIFYGYAPLFYGRVVDFLDVNFFHFTLFGKTFNRWPIFNLADTAVTIGVLILLIFNARTQEKKQDKIIDGSAAQISLESKPNDTITTS
ncbi:MAG TPA: signal peptidase II [Ignavibacteria bacterium]|nr:signal peptidase II [Ignavibacteria bacterium]